MHSSRRGYTMVTNGLSRMCLSFVGQAPPLAAHRLSTIQDDEPPALRPFGGGLYLSRLYALDLQMGQPSNNTFADRRPAHFAPAQKPVGLGFRYC